MIKLGQYYRRSCGTLFKVTKLGSIYDGLVMEIRPGTINFRLGSTISNRQFDDPRLYEFETPKNKNFEDLYQKLL